MIPIKLLHTADLHLGQHLMFADRKLEHQSFLDWLANKIEQEQINLLIMAGDIFDTGTPPNYALQMYYKFLMKVSQIESCRDVVIIGGNHDSVSTLNAPKEILSLLNVHIIGGMTEDLQDEIIVTKDEKGEVNAVVCAVPFLNDRDVRKSIIGESYAEKSQKLMQGIEQHYLQVKNLALELRNNYDEKTPLIATGHLFAAGGKTSEGIRDIYVGSLSHFPATGFPAEFDYVALGHLHKPQIVNKNPKIRYAGSPIPLSFGEVSQTKQVIIYDSNNQEIKQLEIPNFRILKQIKGSLVEIEAQIEKLITLDTEVWLEIQLKETEYKGDIVQKIHSFTAESKVKVFKIINKARTRKQLTKTDAVTDLVELSVTEVFEKRLQAEDADFSEDIKLELMQMFNETVNEVQGEKNEN